ncbi:hypothetical protein AB1J28_11555 [Lysinibacillus irui]|uniref:hypothetical protein n=1 Tax=Lysinibacillus irui TaxID=2998077 RepID=UPI003D2C8CC8
MIQTVRKPLQSELEVIQKVIEPLQSELEVIQKVTEPLQSEVISDRTSEGTAPNRVSSDPKGD